MEKPNRLYKYERISLQSLLNLKKQIVYFASPLAFNDPYDCAIKAQIREPSFEELKNLKQVYLKKLFPAESLFKLEKMPINDFKDIIMRAARTSMSGFTDDFIKKRGVSCFSEVHDEMLMWGHYADKFTGFCLEFDTNDQLFSNAKKVDYSDEIPKINLEKTFASNNKDDLLKLFCTKSKHWEYEKEWRCIHDSAGTAYTYKTESLTGVYFGPNIDKNLLEIICLILQGTNNKVKFWKGKRSDTTFKVEFEEFDYIPAVVVEQLNLMNSI